MSDHLSSETTLMLFSIKDEFPMCLNLQYKDILSSRSILVHPFVLLFDLTALYYVYIRCKTYLWKMFLQGSG